MTKLIEDLLALQSLLKLGETATVEQKARIDALRSEIPAPVLAHFLRQLACGRRGLALVRNGVCGECHIRLSRAMLQVLAASHDLAVCECCGSFLTLAPEEAPTGAVAEAKPRRPRKPRVVTLGKAA
jgi:predicted  nucleic acid-binding Zn-ribbon protein